MIEEVNKKQKNWEKVLGYAVGSVVLFGVACIVIPKLLQQSTGLLYKLIRKMS
ncbi:MAG TPA: hypothetical protein IAC96_06760 [Candidatus Fimimorpha faecalis]|mgnify:CR=1 FL=1|uniref:Uncharacterized protein n=1 Tax=Candidatus Fimimorpha faecalis TaxID=2840824 RepID=A0A9D1JDN0_9FIRM|nr:hypothetical protein [Candidatus Fimimorpha faecalis]